MKEEDIRPADLFEQYLRLSAEDARTCFDGVRREDVSCPGCASQERTHQFDKHGFDYATCDQCGTLYQTPRPSIRAFERFYNDSISSRYWAEKFFPVVAETRREHIFLPRVERLIELCNEKGVQSSTVMDVGAGYGIFLEEWKKRYPQARTIAIEPSSHLAKICRNKGLEVVDSIAEKVEGYEKIADMVLCFEVLEHVFDPFLFVKVLSGFVKPGGYLMVSTLGVDGFDIQVLWDKSKSISPPHHINFLSRDGFYKLFERAGLVDIDLITPGVLDVDIVRNAFKKDPSTLEGNRFVRKLLEDDRLSESFQNFLVSEKLSSHVWVFSRKE
ncbi:MAG: class I SAM-dependent methyltransferase [Candidatus Odinarchaeota archaeon]